MQTVFLTRPLNILKITYSHVTNTVLKSECWVVV